MANVIEGDWFAEWDNESRRASIGFRPQEGVTIYIAYVTGGPDEQVLATAHLMAASKRMREVIEGLIIDMEMGLEQECSVQEWLKTVNSWHDLLERTWEGTLPPKDATLAAAEPPP